MSDYVVVVTNWGRFQHYKAKNPPWIKFHTSLLDDYDFQRLPGDAKWQLLLLWLIAARQDNRIPDDREWLASLFHITEDELQIDVLIDRGWLERRVRIKQAVPESDPEQFPDWASRHVSAPTRTELLKKAKHKCQACSSMEKLEVDHILPISKGGDGRIENLQILCRSCNRKKRSRNIAAQELAGLLPSPPPSPQPSPDVAQQPSPSTTAVQLQAESESDPRARANSEPSPEFAEQF